ncbi:histidine--tRNA ligase [Campylobacter sp. MIT 21-1685]|uniref:histidine--tRNA ligase n=1 Tax=unclassified Campylobacter TaxID=2593542 RepID=UPI00224B63E6|nr:MULTISPECIES: histidine--tRNA ligase [unclassified Campylobacter]MCX2683578.1 histidine--tRNA ligase [Campylobacter sp. MIT 21-1684]MCX2751861.1 histidine--tRNA ligase [Campylobacter sp. MIT 21-1682]MCX2808086.1 histidine--tRNA ligase [Campylobacter sp. MIT 21-1685]
MINALKGMKDIKDSQALHYERIIKTCEEVAKNYGFCFINTPHLELCKLFKRSVGESSDIVAKEMYEFNDKGGNEVCLRPEGTAGIVRAYIEHKFDKTQLTKRWFYHGSMFRYEKPQKGRLREFHQFGVESFGISSVYEDASLILMLVDIFSKLQVTYKLLINSLGCTNCLNVFKQNFLDFLATKEGFCQDCKRRKEINPIRILDCKNEQCQNLLNDAPFISEHLCKNCQMDFDTLQQCLRDSSIEFEVDLKLVRGLDYYSKTAFEFISDQIGAKSAIAGGGRYDKLLEYLGGKGGYGVGFALGVERIIDILEQQEQKDKRSGMYLCALDEPYIQKLFTIAQLLRKKNKVVLSYEAKKLGKHLELADKGGFQFCICIGENEAKNDTLFCRDLENKTEKIIAISNLEKSL